jgi:hypothetical protein
MRHIEAEAVILDGNTDTGTDSGCRDFQVTGFCVLDDVIDQLSDGLKEQNRNIGNEGFWFAVIDKFGFETESLPCLVCKPAESRNETQLVKDGGLISKVRDLLTSIVCPMRSEISLMDTAWSEFTD